MGRCSNIYTFTHGFFIYIFIAAALIMVGPEATTFADGSCWWIGAALTLLGILMIGWPFILI